MILTLLIAASVAASGSRTAKPDARTVPTGGTATAMKALAAAYETKDPDALDALYTADYEYIAVRDPDSGLDIPVFNRDSELLAARNLFRGVTPDGKTAMPAAQTIDVTMKGLHESADPEHPDSLDCYRLVVCEQFGLDMKMAGGTGVKTKPTLHVFHLARGDAAVLTGAQTADPKRWYIRRWVDDVKGLENALALRKGDCNPQPVPIEETISGLRLTIQPLGNPACPTIDLMCTVPSSGTTTVEVIDIQGRRVNRQTVEIAKPGVQKLQAGVGATIKPGAYIVRITQGSAHASQKVLVAR